MFERALIVWQRRGIAAALVRDFGLPEREAETMCGFGTNGELPANEEFFALAKRLKLSFADTARLIAEAELEAQGIAPKAIANLLANRRTDVSAGNRNRPYPPCVPDTDDLTRTARGTC